MSPADWQSLAPLTRLARGLLGETDGTRAVAAWLDTQARYVHDASFARLFTDHLDLPGIRPPDCNHRLVEADGLRVLGGIRFFGEDVTRPFVEVVAWTRTATAAGALFEREATLDEDDCDRLRGLVAREWAAFGPRALRLASGAGGRGLPARWRGTEHVDVTVHAASPEAMRADDGTVTLAPFADVAEAVRLVEARFAALARDAPALARDVTPAEADDLARWHADGTLHAIRHAGRTVGAIATVAGAVEWLPGTVVAEEVVASEHAGHGFAAAAQRALASGPSARGGPLIGTIDGRNHASRRSAENAGRAERWRYVFLPLRP